jgi:hypothetical protein
MLYAADSAVWRSVATTRAARTTLGRAKAPGKPESPPVRDRYGRFYPGYDHSSQLSVQWTMERLFRYSKSDLRWWRTRGSDRTDSSGDES